MIVTKKTLSRRTVLRGLGVSLALPFLDGMVPAFARASATQPVRRFGAVYIPNGILMSKWTPPTEGFGFEFTPTLKPLERFRESLTVISGLNVAKNAGASLHSRASTRWLTGVPPKGVQAQAQVAAGVSMDQIAAKVFGRETQFASLELSLEPNDFAGSCDPGFSCAYINTISWRGPTTPLPMEHNPRVVFERLFGDAGTTDPAARMARLKKDQSLLDSILDEANWLTNQVGAGDRRKIGEYLDAVRDVERRLQKAEEQKNKELPLMEQPASVPAVYEDYAKLMFDLQVLAHQTDLTRITTFMLGRELSGRQYPEIGAPDAHHPTSHHQNAPEKQANYARINEFHTKIFSYFVERLQATQDGEGSLLDNMVLLYGAGMSDGNLHATSDLPLVLLGGGAGNKGGRHVRYPAETPLPNLHLTLLDRLGVHIDSLGDSTGELEHLWLS
ncbi:MAG: DUF1552 domain-containing protein [Vicinamibacterales bacterium]